MPILISTTKTSPSTTFQLVADRISQSESDNSTRIRCRLRAINTGDSTSRFLDYGRQDGSIDGRGLWGRRESNPFMPSGVNGGAIRWDESFDVDIPHSPAGFRNAITFRMILDYGPNTANLTASFDDFPRIATQPSAPSISSISNLTTSSARINGTTPTDDGGADILDYQFQAALNTTFTSGVVTTTGSSRILDIGGLTSGRRYYFRMRARNRRGFSPYSSGTPSAIIPARQPSAPSISSISNLTTSSARINGTTPTDDGGADIIDYQFQAAINTTFTSGVVTTTGSSRIRDIGGLNSGRLYYFRMRARNSAGFSPYSSGTPSASIPARPPSAPSISSISNVTSSSARINGTTPTDDGGASILFYEFQAALNTTFTSGVVTTTGSSRILDIGGLTPGQTYYFRLRARNSAGFSPYSSGTPSAFVGLPAPTFTSWQQNSAGQLLGNWTAPNPANGLSGYRLQLARDQGFTTGVQNIELGNITSHAVAGLAGGRTWYARVAARTAGGINAFSAARSQLLILSAGNLDNWTRVGTPPAAVTRYTAAGIRRGTIGGRQALFTESVTTAAATLPANTIGIQRTATGLKVGTAYRYSARAQLANPTAVATRYQLRVIAQGSAPAVTITSSSTSLGLFEFVADSTSATLQIMLSDAVTTATATDVFENVAFTQISLLELATDYPVRLRSTVYESNLANHFDLACNSAGASWFVAKDGVTRFRLPGSALPVSALFSDAEAPGALHYVDVNASYDTRGMVNRLDVTNYGVTADGTLEDNENLIVVAQQSINTYGVRSSRLEVNLWDKAPYDASLAGRMAELLVDAAEPRLFVSSFRWNAQQNPPAANELEVGQRITVQFKNTTQDSQIVHLQHEITPRRWIITVTVKAL